MMLVPILAGGLYRVGVIDREREAVLPLRACAGSGAEEGCADRLI